MNQFKHLDQFFPCGEERLAGEVVCVQVSIRLAGSEESLLTIWDKRKAWYVNASVNAFHLHRNLCRDARLGLHGIVPDSIIRDVKRQLAVMVLISYMENHETNEQYHEFALTIGKTYTRVAKVK